MLSSSATVYPVEKCRCVRQAERFIGQLQKSGANAWAPVLEALTKALHDKKARALIALLANDAVAFDLAPPLQLGPNVMHDPAPLEEWFATWRGPIVSAPFYRTIVVGGDVAYASGLQHMTGTKVDGENAVPFAMDGTDKALVDLKPPIVKSTDHGRPTSLLEGISQTLASDVSRRSLSRFKSVGEDAISPDQSQDRKSSSPTDGR